MIRKFVVFLLLASASLALYAQTNPCAGMSLGANADLGGFQFGTTASPWRQNVTGYTVDANSAAWQGTLGSEKVFVAFAGTLYGPSGIRYSIVDSSVTPFVPVNLTLYGGDNTGYPLPPNLVIEGGLPICPYDPATTSDGGDHHIIVVDRNKCELYEAWRGSFCGGQWSAANGAVWDATTEELRPYGLTSADAAGLPIFPGLATYYDCVTAPTYVMIGGVSTATCGHALRYTMNYVRCIAYNSGGISGFILPATHGACTNSGGYNIHGSRIRLHAAYNTSSFTGEALTIANTLKYYGGIEADQGRDLALNGSDDPRWNTTTLLQLQVIAATDFDLLNQGTVYYADGRTLEGTIYPNTPVPVPTGALPTNSTPTATPSVIVQGNPAILARTLGANSSYEFFTNGPPIRASDSTAVVYPTGSTCYPLVSNNQYGLTTSSPACVTVLVPPYRGMANVNTH